VNRYFPTSPTPIDQATNG